MILRVHLFILLDVTLVRCALPTSTVDYTGYKVVEIVAKDAKEFSVLSKLHENSTLDFWLDSPGPGHPAHLLLPPIISGELANLLTVLNTTVLVEDVERFFESEREIMKFHRDRLHDESSYGATYRYNNLFEVQNYLYALSQSHSDIMSVEALKDEYGNVIYTHEGRTITMAKIGSRSEGEKRAMWIDAGLHAREWISTAVAMYIIDQLVTRYENDDAIRQYVDKLDWYIVPVANPDGYVYSWTHNRMWRKNVNRNSGGCWGVDINRNFDWYWGRHSTSYDPCRSMYGGQSAASEPETKALQSTILRLSSHLVGLYSLHSYSQLWLYPFAHDYGSPAVDWDELERMAYESMNTVSRFYGTRYSTGTAASTLYAASGTSTDWAKGVAHVKYTYLIELRPEMGRQFNYRGFTLPESQIVPTGSETFAGMKVLADKIIEDYY